MKFSKKAVMLIHQKGSAANAMESIDKEMDDLMLYDSWTGSQQKRWDELYYLKEEISAAILCEKPRLMYANIEKISHMWETKSGNLTSDIDKAEWFEDVRYADVKREQLNERLKYNAFDTVSSMRPGEKIS